MDLNLATKPNPEVGPKVSKLPLPLTDSALVIDLPDGQKIVIGKMTQGSVIEVATWRGVGRPDSRTSRLMLGVGTGSGQEESADQIPTAEQTRRPVKPTDWKIVLYYLAMAVQKVGSIQWKPMIKKATDAVSKIKAPKKRKVSTASTPAISAPAPTPSGLSSSSTVDEDVEAWLNKISENAAKRAIAAPKASKSVVKKPAPAKKRVEKPTQSKSKRK